MDIKSLAVLISLLCHQSLQELLSCTTAHVFSTSFEVRPREHGQQQFAFNPLNNILGNVDVCSIFRGNNDTLVTATMSTPIPAVEEGAQPKIHATFPQSQENINIRHIEDVNKYVTKCDRCNQCPQNMLLVHEFLTKWAKQRQLEKFYVILDKAMDMPEIPNTNVRFVTSEVHSAEKKATEICDMIPEPEGSDALRSFSKTSVLFVSISFIILMVISLAWLVFYYVQRFRYAHAKDRMQRRLFNAAKKALTRIPTKPVKAGDKELDADCPVCIDPYRAGDIVRMLPCRHVFHKTCVDPWLLEHRTCPMCKSDILKAFGYQVNMNNNSRRRAQFSGQIDDHNGIHVESDRLSSNSTASESNAYPYPVVSEIHDPFSFTPSTSPQLMQVMNEMNARAFSIIPLTVHSGNNTSNPGSASGSHHHHHPRSSIEQGGSSSSNRIVRSAASNSTSRKIRGHVVNLVHVRSRSLSQSQMPHQEIPVNTVGKDATRNDRRPSALFRRGIQNADSITIEIPPAAEHKPPSPAPTQSNIISSAQDDDKSAFVRMAISHENVAGSKSNIPRSIGRGHSVKTVGARQQPNRNFCRRISGQPQIGSFPMLPNIDVRPVTAVVSETAQNPRTVPLSSTLSIESL